MNREEIREALESNKIIMCDKNLLYKYDGKLWTKFNDKTSEWYRSCMLYLDCLIESLSYCNTVEVLQ
jgi:hypothetical protein